jgi:putative intracellular protease/amidase
MFVVLAVLVIVSALGPSQLEGQDPKVLMIIKANSSPENAELMLTQEVGVMTDMLEQAGFEVVVATASGQTVVGGTASVESDLKLEDVNVADYSGVIIPCMAVGLEVDAPAPEAPVAASIVKQAVADGKPVAAQVSSVLILAEAGVLSGKKYAFPSDARESPPSLEDAVYSGNGIVQDGMIITSGVCPLAAKNRDLKDGTPDLTQAFISQLTGGK